MWVITMSALCMTKQRAIRTIMIILMEIMNVVQTSLLMTTPTGEVQTV